MRRFPLEKMSAAVGLAAILAGCAQPAGDTAFTVRKIDSAPGASGAVRVKLSTPGEVAEADAALILQYVKIVAVREATKRQRQIAQERARNAHRAIVGKAKVSKRKVRYLAVATEKSEPVQGRTSRASVMIWDTQTQEIVGNNVYDVETPPRLGGLARFDIYSAEYVGVGGLEPIAAGP